LGRIAGVEVRLDWSLLVVFWLILVNLGLGVFPARHPDWNPATSWGVAAVAAILFLLSILAHELSHAVVGRANGVAVDGITLFIFGGVARMRGEPPSPRAELLMTLAGPFTSLAIGVVALLIGARLAAPVTYDPADPFKIIRHVSPLASVLLWLGPINVVLALFNLVPGFPLDGGRVLRAILWAATHDFARATRWAAGAGQAFGLLLIFAGIAMMFGIRLPYLGSGFVPGLWMAFIGWFLSGAAATSYRQVVLHDLLDGIPVAAVMRRGLGTVDPNVAVARFVEDYLMPSDQRAFPVVEGNRPVGIITLGDVRKLPRGEWAGKRVRDIMTGATAMEVAGPQESASSALAKLSAREVEQLPVVADDGQLVGVVRRRDIARWLELQPSGSRSLREREA
jgi:Zn-dependent protease/CBS domain-containing protein